MTSAKLFAEKAVTAAQESRSDTDMPGKLNIISTPIGNYADMTLRGLRLINESDLVVCEEYKEALKLLRFFGIKKELISLNEHNEEQSAAEVYGILFSGRSAVLMSDCGTPGFADPGNKLINMCIESGIDIEYCGGANSVIAALPLSGFDISRFFFAGFLSPKSDIRKSELKALTKLERSIVLLEAPYRLKQVLSDISATFTSRRTFVAFDLTQSSETLFRGTSEDILNQIGEENLKGEFVIIIDKP